MRDFRNIKAWEKSHSLTLGIYKATTKFPSHEQFGLTAQVRRASVSIPSNIAEGCGRNTENELKRFLEIALGSASEVEYQLLLARDLHYLDSATYTELSNQVIEVKKMLSAYTRSVNRNRFQG
jgi:four helix bundle protein